MSKIVYPFLRAKKFKSDALEQYYEEPKILGDEGLYKILDQGKQWSDRLAATVNEGGAVLVPHTFLSKCGYQIAAAVHAILDSGADQALVLGMFHPLSPALVEARIKELNKEDISQEPSWGVLGPDIDNRDASWKTEFSLDLFNILFDAEVKRRGVIPPKLIVRFPSLVNRDPASLPGIKELKKIAKDSVIVATDDMCHHGVGYGVPEADAIPCDEKGLQYARNEIEEGYKLLEANNYHDYFYHWMNPMGIGDPTDVAVLLKHLIGDTSINLLDLRLVDVSPLFENDIQPSWVATALVEFKKRS